MACNASWRQEGGCLIFNGCWTHDSVSQYWHAIPCEGIALVDVSGVDRLDSAFLTLLLRVSAPVQSMSIKGPSSAMFSLLRLYNLTALFKVTSEPSL